VTQADVFSEKPEKRPVKAGAGEDADLPTYLTDGPGRRSLVHNQEIVSEIVDNVKVGLTYEVAVQAAGISTATFYNWRRRAELERARVARGATPNPREAPYIEFLDELERAEAQAEAGMVAEVRADAGGAKWILPRRWPGRWSNTNRTNVHVQVEGARSALDVLPPELRERVEALLLARVGVAQEDDESDVIEGECVSSDDDGSGTTED